MESNENVNLGSQRSSKRPQASKSAHNELSRIDPLTGQRMANTEAEVYKKCEQVITSLMNHPSARYFINQVGHTISGSISAPIDLNVVSKRLAQGYYLNVTTFTADVRKIWDNSWRNNEAGTELYIATTAMSENFENLMEEMTNQQVQRQNLKKPKIQSTKAYTSKNNKVPPMNIQEKSMLRQNIMKLDGSKMEGLVKIIKGVVDTEKSQESLEFDLDKLPPEVCRELEAYVNDCINPTQSIKSLKPHIQEHIVPLLTNT